jgi:RNA polymerase sigma-70 factor, ECF subfamily
MAIALRDVAVEANGRSPLGLAADTALTTSALAGDEEALGRLLAAYEHSAYNVAYRLLGREADAKDAVQEACLQTLRAVRGDSQPPRAPDRFRPWFLRTVTNAALTLLRRRPRAPLLSTEVLADELPAPERAEPACALETREARAAVFRALLALPDTQRAALTLREYEGLSYEEIATTLGLTHAAVETLLFRARRAFRAAYEGLPSSFEPVGCPRVAPLLSAMIDGELAAAAWRGLSDHLRKCPCCRRELAQLRRSRRLQALIPTLAVPQGVQWAEHANKAVAGGLAAGPAALSWLGGLFVGNPTGLVAVKTGAAALAMALGMVVAAPMAGQGLSVGPGGVPEQLSALVQGVAAPGETPPEGTHAEPWTPQAPGPGPETIGPVAASSPAASGEVAVSLSPGRLEQGQDVSAVPAAGSGTAASASEHHATAPIVVVADASDRASGHRSGGETPPEAAAAGDVVTDPVGVGLEQLEEAAGAGDIADLAAEVDEKAGGAAADASRQLRDTSSTLSTSLQPVYERAAEPALQALDLVDEMIEELPEAGWPFGDEQLPEAVAEPMPEAVTDDTQSATFLQGVDDETGPIDVAQPLEPVAEPLPTASPTASSTLNLAGSTTAPIATEPPKPVATVSAPTPQPTAIPKTSSTESSASQPAKTTSQTTERTSKTTQPVSKTTSTVSKTTSTVSKATSAVRVKK